MQQSSPQSEESGTALPPIKPELDQRDPRIVFFQIGYIERTQRKIFAAVFSKYQLHPSQGFALSTIVRFPGRSQRELADAMRIERATVTVTLQKLERGGFIRREPDPDDQRIMRIYPTQKGIDAEAYITGEMKRFHEACSKALTEDESLRMRHLLQKLEDAVLQYQQTIK